MRRAARGILRRGEGRMNAPRVAIIGDGKMGRAVNDAAAARGWPVVARARPRACARITRESLGGADVAIEFTTPAAAPANAIACARAGVPVVVGTTGWDAERERVEREVRAANGAMLAAPNFALGVAIYLRGRASGSRNLRGHAPGFNARIVETHHASKVDAPSGTAKALARIAGAAFGGEIPIESVRTGTVHGRSRTDVRRANMSRSARRTRRATVACSRRARSRRPRGSSAGTACSPCAISWKADPTDDSGDRLFGCGTALVTPFRADGAVDEAALRALVDWQIAEGIHFLVPVRLDGRSGDDDAGRAPPRGGDHGRAGARPRADHGGRRRQRHEARRSRCRRR